MKGIPVCSHERCMDKVAADKSVPSYKLIETDKFLVKNAIHWRMKFHFEGPLTGASRDLTKLRRRRQGEHKKKMGLMRKTTTLHEYHAVLYISLLLLHNYDMKGPNFKFT